MEYIDSMIEKFKTGERPSEATFRELIDNIYIDKIIDHSDLREKTVGIFINEEGDRFEILQKTLIFEPGTILSNEPIVYSFESDEHAFTQKYFKLIQINEIKSDGVLILNNIKNVEFTENGSTKNIIISPAYDDSATSKIFITFNFVKE